MPSHKNQGKLGFWIYVLVKSYRTLFKKNFRDTAIDLLLKNIDLTQVEVGFQDEA